MMRQGHILAALALCTATAACNPEQAKTPGPQESYAPERYRQAIGDIARMDDVDEDEARKPGELLAFAQIDRGDVVGDFIMGGGYVTRLLATAVGGDGRVYAFQPEELIAAIPDLARSQDETVRRYSDAEGNPVRVFPLRASLTQPGWPEPLDTIMTVMNFHDLYLSDLPDGTARDAIAAMYAALKPGGTLVVVDHFAADGAGAEAASALHRMDADLALADLEMAGFVLEETSDLYRRRGDGRTANVFDESIRGRTDQFAWRLRKPE